MSLPSRITTSLVTIAALSAALPALAGAQPAATLPASAPPPELPRVTLSISPIHLAFPIVELTAELRVAPKLGVALVAGGGQIDVEGADDKAAVYEGGAQALYYLTGSFRKGLHLGVEAMYAKIDAEIGDAGATGNGLAIGPMAGYKHTFDMGLSLIAQLGVQFIAVRASSDDGDSANAKRVLPMLNLNLGYTF